MTAPSNANTSGLEVVAWVSAEQLEAHTDRPETPTGGRYLPVRKTAAGHFTQGLVTAASAQARIDAEKARADRLLLALGRIERSKSRTFGHLQSVARAALQQEG